MNDFHYLECKHWKGENFFFKSVVRHVGTLELNLGWRFVLVGKVDFEDEELPFLTEILTLWSEREIKSDVSISCARLEGRPATN